VDADYVPVDFDAYSIPDLGTQNRGTIKKEEKIWRISSLTASVDDETKILILPLPESKRQVKIVDTVYQLASYD
jgi:hypothetical protein